MIYEDLNTNSTHINTVLHRHKIHFKNLTENAYTMVYKIKLINTNKVKLINFFEEPMFDMVDGKKQSFVIDWGDGCSTKVFTENINTKIYNTDSSLILEHDYIDTPLNQEIELVIMSEYETLCPIAFDESMDGIEIDKMAGIFAPITKDINTMFRPHVRRKLKQIYSLKELVGGSMFKHYGRGTLLNIFAELPELTDIANNIFDDGCENVTDITQLFYNNSKMLIIPNFTGFTKVETADSFCSGCSEIIYVSDIFSHLPLKNINNGFKNCSTLIRVDSANFNGKTNLNALGIFDGCEDYISAMTDRAFDQATFNDAKYGGIVASFANIPDLVVTDEVVEGEESKTHIMSAFRGYRYYDQMFMNSATDRPFDLLLLDNLNVVSADSMFGTETNTNEVYQNLPNRKVTITGPESSITEMYKNRHLEIFRYPYSFSSVINLNYTGCFIGNRSLYNDQQIFGNLYQEGMRSGITPITSTIIYEVELLRSDIDLKFSTVYNKYNPDMNPELDASVEITIGNGTTIINKAELESMKTGLGFKNIRYTGVTGTKTITVKYTHCAPMTLTYEKTTDYTNYRIISANIELFPTDISYIGKYGLELWSAESVTGDFFRMFYDRPNVVPQTWTDPNTWFSNIFAFFSPKVKTVNKDIFKSIGFVGNITEINDIFRYEYRTDNGRDLFNNFTFGVGLNPFKTFDGTIFRFTPNVTKVRTWFNDSVNNALINISGASLNNLFGSLTKLVIIDRVLHSCELNISGDSNRILWTNNNLVEEVSSYIGRINYLAKDLLMKPKLKKVYRFHVLHMINGKDKEDLADCYMDFANSNNDIDLTEMFYDEKFEIPDGFIRNVKGTLKFNNCFKGSYRFDIVNDNSLFTNVANKTAGHVSGMEFISLAEPLSMEFNGYDTGTGSIGLKLKDKNGSSHRVVARLYSKDTGRYKLLCTKHVVVSDVDTIPDLNLKTGTTGVKLELWCTTANIYLENLSKMRVKNLSGSYGRTSWSANGSMLLMYPGLVPSNIVCEENGGPWRNIIPTNGVIDFTDIFRGTVNKELIDYRVLKTDSVSGTEYNMTNAFAYGSIAEFDIRMFEAIGDVVINGTCMFRQNSDENFNFVNLESGPYIFMELLFTKFRTAREMFRHVSVPRTLFNHAPFFGCDRNGEVNSGDLINSSLHAFMSKYSDSSGNTNNIPLERLPLWSNNVNYGKLDDCWDAFINTRYILSEGDHSILPTTNSTLKFWATMRIGDTSPTFKSIINLKKINDVNGLSGDRSKFTIESDYSFIKTELLNSSIRLCYLFFGEFLQVDDKFLIEPFDTSFNSNNISFLEGINDRPGFRAFKTYAPDNILFRNVKSYTGSSGATLLTYPNFIEYQNIHLTGNQISFIREELAEAHRFSTYLTVHIKYSDAYEEAKWFIVDKNADSYTIDLEASKIVNNTVSIKIQSTQCFYLMKTNVDYVEKLEGTYRKDLQPRDSEFFNFDVDYYYFIERFGADLWKDVKIKQGEKFRFGTKDNVPTFPQNRLISIDGSPFRNQQHITSINYLFRGCKKFAPSVNILDGFSAVTDAGYLFNYTNCDITEGILNPLVNLEIANDIFALSKIPSIHYDTFKYNNRINNLVAVFYDNEITKHIDRRVFVNKIPLNNKYSSMFELTNLKETEIGINSNIFDDHTLKFNASTITTKMFNKSFILDARISWILEGSLNSSNSVNMFASCNTYENREEFESRYGNQTGVTFKCSEPCVYKSSTANLTGRFKLLFSEPTLNKDNEYVKIVVDSGIYYRTLTQLENSGISLATTKVEVYSDYAIIFDCSNVERLEGKFPTHDGRIFDMSNFNLGQKYPNLKYIDPLFFSKLINQSDMSYVFRELRDINIIPSTLFNPMVNLANVESMYSYAGGTINNLADITNFIGPSTNINSMNSLFKNVTIKQLGRKSIKLRTSGTVNLTDAFSGTNAYIDADVFDGTPSSINVTGMFRACKSLYSIDELTNLPNTGDSLLEVLKSFRPTVSIPNSNSEINLMLLHDEPEASKIVDVAVDWGDGSSNIMVGVRVDSITHISRVIATSGDKNLRIWSSYYGVGVKLKSDSTGGIIKHNGGYIGKFIKSSTGTKIVRQFFKKYMPNSTSISSELFNCLDPSISDMYLCFSGSKIESIPSSILKRIETADTVIGGLFELAEKIKNIDENTFKDMAITSSSVNIGWMFRKCVELNSIPENIFKPLGDRNITLNSNGGIFKETKIAPPVNIFKYNNLSDTFSLESMFEYSTANFVFNYNVFSKVKKCTNLKRMFSNVSSIDFGNMTVIDSNYLSTDSLVDMTEMFFNYGSNLNNRIDIKVLDFKQNVRLNIEKSLTNVRSIYTEEEIFDYNETVGVSGLISDNRTILRLTVDGTGNLELLKNYNSKYDSKVLIKINGRNHSKHDYTNIGIDVTSGDIVEVITFGDIKDVFYTVNSDTSVSKVKHLDGILNIGSESLVDGKFKTTIVEAFGPDIETISDTFFTNFDIVTNASGLCKGLNNLKTIPNGLIKHFSINTNWNSFFENCASLKLSNENSEMFKLANKGVSFNYMFKNCTSLTYIPPKFFLWNTESNKTFVGTFTNTRVTAIPDDIDEF